MEPLVRHFCSLPRVVRKPLWRYLHRLLLHHDISGVTTFLNYGYASTGTEEFDLPLLPWEKPHRNAVNLYHHVTRSCPLEGRRILEVSSGRGGGAAFLTRYRKPAEYIGLDIDAGTAAFCNRIHPVPGLSFIRGEAENLPFPDARFDAVVNVESARSYGSPTRFFREVHRVLEPGGWFLFADVFKRKDAGGARDLLSRAGFGDITETDIREKVIRAMEQDSLYRIRLIDALVPPFLRRAFYEFAAVKGSDRFGAFQNGDFQYRSFTMRKPSDLAARHQ